MTTLAPFSLPGPFLRGNLHCHTNNSDGALPTEQVIKTYQDAGYDFLAITDHFLTSYDFPVTDTRRFQTERFTPILATELHAPRTESGHLWHVGAIGLPADFAPTSPDEDGPSLARRARAAGAFVSIVHPGWYSLSLADAHALDAAHAVEIYNHGCQLMHDKGDGAYLLDGMLDQGRRLHAYAVDDAHFHSPDFGGAWMELKAASRSADAIVEALKAGHFYSTQGPRIDAITMTDDAIEVDCSAAEGVLAVGAGYLKSHCFGTGLTRARVPLEPLRDSPWFRIVVFGQNGKKAWSNPVWRDSIG